jgi:two-component system nitrogen regulation response regulator GlnG
VRELENLCWRLSALAPGETITVADLDGALTDDAIVPGRDWENGLIAWARDKLAHGEENIHAQARDRLDRALLQAALAHTGGRRTEAATRLGLGRNTLTRKLGSGRKPRH